MRAAALRQRSSDAETLLWYHLRSRRMLGLKFRRQHPVGRYFADFACVEIGLVIELDGWLNHESWSAGNRDAARDLEDLAAGRSVARLRYGQVFGEACRTAERIGRALQARGWTGTVRRCGPCCTVEPG